ncbi:histone H2B type F-M-like isoform X2 [Pongo pygmaeus]|uniref:histone H2B type F-M-like isoform X2 n=1 Tax=Pongo pygmaeus TaxID=9600 RepID=UPI00300CCCF4
MAAASTMAEASSETTSGENQSIQEPKEANSTTVQKQKRRGRRGSRRRHANCRGDSFAPYFPRVLKQVHQGLSLSQEAVSVMDSMVHDILDRIATEAGQLARYTKRVTITSRDIQMAVRLLLPGKMGKLAEAQGTNAALSEMNTVPQMEMQKSPVFCVARAGSCRLELFLFGHLGSSPLQNFIMCDMATEKVNMLIQEARLLEKYYENS